MCTLNSYGRAEVFIYKSCSVGHVFYWPVQNLFRPQERYCYFENLPRSIKQHDARKEGDLFFKSKTFSKQIRLTIAMLPLIMINYIKHFTMKT